MLSKYTKKCLQIFCLGSLFFLPSLNAVDIASSVTIIIQFQSLTELSISNSPFPLIISKACAGCHPCSVVDNSSSYSVITNANQRKISAYINAEMPPGTNLQVMMLPPKNAICNGFVPLTPNPRDLVCGIANSACYNLPITYIFSAQANAAPCQYFQRTITYTISP